MAVIGSRWKATGNTLGSGGQGQVLVVVDTTSQFSGSFAAKIIHNAARSERVAREIRVMKQLSEAGAPILTVVDDYLVSDPEAKRPWFVTPIVKDGNLAKQIVAGQAYGGSPTSALEFFLELLRAVKQVHKHKVAHRDLKPDNILLGSESILLADLGLCLPLEDLDGERLTGELERIGSVNYLPLEAFGRRPLDQDQYAFDCYALGKILYQLLAGRQLPGFVSPVDADYDISKIDNSPVIRAVNRTLRGLLHETPAVRIATLAHLDEQIEDLLATTPGSDPPKQGLTEMLMRAADAIAEKAVFHPPTSENDGNGADLPGLIDEIFGVWSESSALRNIRDVLIEPHGGVIELHQHKESTKLKELLRAPLVTTHRAMEPLEDLGYPQFPQVEAGCAIGVAARKESSTLPAIWLGAQVAIKNDQLFVALAIVTRTPGKRPITDIVLGTEQLVKGNLHDATLVPKIRQAADDSIAAFGQQLADKLMT